MQRQGQAASLVVALLLCASAVQAQAPAAEQQPLQPKPDWLSYKDPYIGEENNITKPKLSPEEVTLWSQDAIADILSFGPGDYKTKLGGFKKYFVPAGWQAYADFLRNAKLIDKVKDEGYAIRTIVTTPPDIVSHSLVEGGAYHWIVKLPVTLSFFIGGNNNRDKADASGNYLVFIDVTRVSEGGDKGIAIQNWRVDDVPAPSTIIP